MDNLVTLKTRESTSVNHKVLMESWLKERIQELQNRFDLLGMNERRFGWDLVLDGQLDELESFLRYVESLK